jgi:hypothetical protein
MRTCLALLLLAAALCGTLAVSVLFTPLCLPALALLERALAEPTEDDR